MSPDQTRDAAFGSRVPGAVAGADLPAQDLSLGVFSRRGSPRRRIGTAIGDAVLERPAAVEAGLLREDGSLRRTPRLNLLLARGEDASRRFHSGPSSLLRLDSAAASATTVLVALAEAELRLSYRIGDSCDFSASIRHATDIGSVLRPDNRLVPDDGWISGFAPIGFGLREGTVTAAVA